VFSPWSVPEKKARKWMWIGLAIVAALQFYYVQEMIAAFVVLGVVFALVAGVGLLLFLVDRASERTQSWVEMCALAIAHTARRGVNLAGTLTARRAAARSASPSSIERGTAIHV
jgi:uncharacterized membrane protein YraQ (UPF0718 family)